VVYFLFCVRWIFSLTWRNILLWNFPSCLKLIHEVALNCVHSVMWALRLAGWKFLSGLVDLRHVPQEDGVLTLSNLIFLPPTYSPALIYFGRERGWVACNYPTVLKEENRNMKSTACSVCWLKSVLHEEKRWEQENHNVGRGPTLWFSCSWRFSSCNMDFSQQIAQVVLFLFLFFSFKTVG
jgi:hypothetical protein